MPPLNNPPTSPILIEDSDDQSNGSQTLVHTNLDANVYYAKIINTASVHTEAVNQDIDGNDLLNCDILPRMLIEKIPVMEQNLNEDAQCDKDDAEENSGASSEALKMIYSCHRCKLAFSSRLTFEEHYKQNYNEAPVYTCQVCDKQMKNRRSYQRHFNRHTNTREFKCTKCSKTFSVEKLYKQHNTVHNLTTAKSCAECQLEFFDLYEFKAHCRDKHSQKKEQDRWECTDCGKIMKNRSSLGMHMKIHKNDRQFCCPSCDQKFVQKINLINHVKAHNAIKTHSCEECGKSFVGQSQLLRHHTYHTNVRTFECEICKKMYKTKRDLKLHSMVHQQQRPHKCSSCEKTFLSTSKLKQHLNIHSGERPYKCHYCPKDFTNFPNWLKHTRRRHKVDHKTGEKLVVMPKFLNKDKKPSTNDVRRQKPAEPKRKKTTKTIKKEIESNATMNIKIEQPIDIIDMIVTKDIETGQEIPLNYNQNTNEFVKAFDENKQTNLFTKPMTSTDLSTITVNDKTLPLNTSDDLERAASLLMQQPIDLDDEIEYINIKSETIDTSFYQNSINYYAPNDKITFNEPIDYQTDHLLSSIDSSSLFSYYTQAQSTQCDFAMLPLPPINTVKSKLKTIDSNATHIYTSTANVL